MLKIAFLILAFFLITRFDLRAQTITYKPLSGAEKKYDLSELKKKLTSEKVMVYNDKFRQIEEYKGFKVFNLIQSLKGDSKFKPVKVITKTGYSPILESDVLNSGEGYFVFEKTNGKFTSLDYRTTNLVSLAPLYLVWPYQNKFLENKKEKDHWWIYQITGFEEVKSKLVSKLPKEAPKAIVEGASLYEAQCLRCHNKDSKSLSYDLLSPNILKRKTKKWLVNYIYSPPKKGRSKMMPAYKDVFPKPKKQILEIANFIEFEKDPSKFIKKSNKLKSLDKIFK